VCPCRRHGLQPCRARASPNSIRCPACSGRRFSFGVARRRQLLGIFCGARRSLRWLSICRWRPAAKYFVYVSASAIVGRVLVALIVQRVGRRPVGIVFGFAAALAIGLAGYFHSMLLAGFPLFVVLIATSAFFVEGGMGSIAPYTIEQYGVRLGSRASGLGHAAAGVGKITGPLALVLIAGTGNLVRPQATAAAVFPALLLLALCMLAVAFAFIFLAVETHGRAMAFGSEEEPAASQQPVTSAAG